MRTFYLAFWVTLHLSLAAAMLYSLSASNVTKGIEQSLKIGITR